MILVVKGHVIVIGTDGIWETHSSDGKMFGKDRLKEVIRTHSSESSAAIIQALEQALNEYHEEAGQLDDMTIAVVKVT